MRVWFDTPTSSMEDSHLLNARVKAMEKIDEISDQIDDTPPWKEKTLDRLENLQAEYELGLKNIEEELDERRISY